MTNDFCSRPAVAGVNEEGWGREEKMPVPLLPSARCPTSLPCLMPVTQATIGEARKIENVRKYYHYFSFK